MSSWITNGLKTLRIRVGGAVGSVSQPRYFGAQVTEVKIPPRPKKPLTPYFRFMGQVRAEVKNKNPNLKVTDLIKLMGQQWDRLDESAKQSYISAYRNEMQSYASVIEKYKQSLSPEQKEAQQQMKLDSQLLREKREKKRRLKELGKPKRPASPFFLFLSSKVTPGSKIADYQDAAKKLGEVWKTMSDAEKEPFAAKYKEDLRLYEKSMTKWEDKMIKQGNDDVVRESKSRKVKDK
ncbi:Transcription factor A, mitochondrial [Orchesella cincta]|uniref:Transcription factor A, mitochondrial n=1 Tax=Orchesella cincta TaxID=48709 RepID=A0A1D2N8G9_ORCCI|nr:Transcription factor A, mitochondrial [Orchesella cincta]